MVYNFNNPQFLSLSDSYSTVSATLENPAVKSGINYGDFTSADPYLSTLLPKNLNYGITSPGTVHMETDCSGLDFMNTNPDYDKLPFKVCLEKFSDQYKIPEMTFNNLMNNLPYTFSSLSEEEKKRYLKSLQEFVNKESKHKKVQFQHNNKKENFGNGTGTDSDKNECFKNNLMTNVLYICIVVILVVLFLLFIKRQFDN